MIVSTFSEIQVWAKQVFIKGDFCWCYLTKNGHMEYTVNYDN